MTSTFSSFLIMMFETSKRRTALLLIFLIKCFNKQFILDKKFFVRVRPILGD